MSLSVSIEATVTALLKGVKEINDGPLDLKSVDSLLNDCTSSGVLRGNFNSTVHVASPVGERAILIIVISEDSLERSSCAIELPQMADNKMIEIKKHLANWIDIRNYSF